MTRLPLLIANLAPGATRFMRVTVTNASGQSLPTEVVGARADGFTRLQAYAVSGSVCEISVQ